MKLWEFLSLVILFSYAELFPQTDTTFISLRGFEDSVGNTQLVYETKQTTFNLDVDSTILTYNDYDVSNGEITIIDQGFNNIYFPEDHLQFKHIDDIEFFNSDPKKYIYTINSLGIDPDGRISRYDSNDVAGILGFYDDLYISPENQLNVNAIAGKWIDKSYDGGFNWTGLSEISPNGPYISYLTFSPFDESIIYGISLNNNLVKSVDTGKTFIDVVNTGDWNTETKLFFDNDKVHIYAVINIENNDNYYNPRRGLLYISDNNGNPYSWRQAREEYNKIDFCLDDSVSGNVFMSVANTILESKDYGNNFTQFTELPHHANGIYKKPKQDLLYAAISNSLLEIKPDSILQILKNGNEKSLEIFPIVVGNKWIYYESGLSYPREPPSFNYYFSAEITKDTIDSKGFHYYYFTGRPYEQDYWLRIDSSSGNIYRRYSFEDETEYLNISLLAGNCDEIEISDGIIYDIVESDTLLWNKKRYSKIYKLQSLFTYEMTFAQGIGIVEMKNEFDFGYSTTTLKGCIIDGIVYGDTILVAVNDFRNNLPTQLSLSQNYPNPFNPTTVIEYVIPNVASGFSLSSTILKVYDVLGREVATLVNQPQKPGSYKITFDGNNLASGIYYYQLKNDNFIETKKMILLR